MASGVGGAGGPNKFPYGNHDDDIQSAGSGSSGRLGGHEVRSDSFAEKRKLLEKTFRPGSPSNTSSTSSNKGKNKNRVKSALSNAWNRVKELCKHNHKQMQISHPSLPKHVKHGVRTPGIGEIMLRFQGKTGQGNQEVIEEGAHGGSDSKGDIDSPLEGIPGGEEAVASTSEGPRRSSGAEASGFRGIFPSGASGFTHFKAKLAGIFKSGHAGGYEKLETSSSGIGNVNVDDTENIDAPRDLSTGMTLEELLEAEKNLSELIDKTKPGASKARLQKWRASIRRGIDRVYNSGNVSNVEENFDPMRCSDQELQQAVAEGLACEAALQELDAVLETASKEIDSEASGPASSHSGRSVHTEEGSSAEEILPGGAGPQGRENYLKKLLSFLLRVIRNFLRAARKKLRNARRATMEWIRRTCPCRRGEYRVSLYEDDVNQQRTAEWVLRHFGSGSDSIVLPAETVDYLSEDSSEKDDMAVETYFRDFQNLIEKTENSDITPTSRVARMLNILTRDLGNWLPSIGFSSR